MDVRCEKCHTEYELEESKVTEAGVTVKCTSCGNLFKIKRKTTLPPPRPPEPAPIDVDGMWLIRSPGGEARRFKELTTLQQWVVERKVTREAELSRTGETWKKLGDIAELASFFAIVDQAQAAARPPAATPRKPTDPMAPSTVGPARAPSMPAMPRGEFPLNAFADDAVAHADTMYATQPVLLAEPPRSDRGPPPPASERPRAAATAVVRKPDRRRESWIGNAVSPDESDPSWANSAGGFDDDGSVAKNQRTVKVEPSPFAPDEFGDFELGRRRRGGRGFLWIIAIILAGGGAAAYFLFKPAGEPVVAVADAGSKAAPVAGAAADGGAAAAASTESAQKLLDALTRLNEDTDEGFAAAAKILEGAHVADAALDARFRAAEALVETTASQALADDASVADADKKADPAQVRAEADRRLQRAGKLARDAAAKSPNDPDVAVALADVLRLEKKPAADVEKALAPAGDKPEALYVKALLRARDGKDAEAVELLEKAIAAKAKEGGELLRARYRLAVLDGAQKKPDDAKRELDAIVAAQPAHARAKALRARLDAPAQPPPPPAPPVAIAKPAEPEPRTEKPSGRTPPPVSDDVGSGPIASGAYDGLIAKGNKLAENGDCVGAMRTFERALDARPGGVEALTGIGYCYLDRKQYGQALSNFRAALGISSRYNEALIGMAEAYRYQGMAKEAVTYYRRYLEAAPGGPKAAMARRHVQELGGSDDATAAPAPQKETPPPPPAPAAPATAPPLDKLPDRPGGGSAPGASPAPPSIDKLPDKPGGGGESTPEKPAEPPPPSAAPPDRSAGEPAAPDTPH